MFDSDREQALSTVELSGWVGRLATLRVDVPDAERIDQLGVLESVKAAAAAAQARVTAAFEASQRAEQAGVGVSAPRRGVGIAQQVALARRESPTHGSRHLGVATALVCEMPSTFAALARGEISEWRATLVVRATAVLTLADRQVVDARLAGRLGGLSDRAVDAAARAAAYERDPRSAVERCRQVAADRRVTVRPAPDLMTWVSALVPLVQGVAVFKALTEDAAARHAGGDARSMAQIKADTFVERATGQAQATAVPLEVGLVMTDTALLAGADTPARVEHYGPLPAAAARQLVRSESTTHQATVWLRRIFTDPVTGQVSGVERRRRRFSEQVRRVVVTRDQWCRTPWCGAPIRHVDHVTAYAVGGATEVENAQGLCERCNYVKQAPGWQARVDLDPRAGTRVTTRTPTGHSYSSTAPAAVPGGSPPVRPSGERVPQAAARSA